MEGTSISYAATLRPEACSQQIEWCQPSLPLQDPGDLTESTGNSCGVVCTSAVLTRGGPWTAVPDAETAGSHLLSHLHCSGKADLCCSS